MPKNLSAAVLAQVAGGDLKPAFFVEIAFQTETVWIWGGFGKITAPGPAADSSSTFPYGQTFTGCGWLGHIDAVPQVSDVIAQNITLVLAGIPVHLLTDAVNAVRQNSSATVWLALLDANNNVIRDPTQLFAGALDVPIITEGGETCAISITVENELIDLNRAPSRRYTDVDQQFDFPGDTGFSFVELLQDYNITWPFPYKLSNNSGTPPPNFLTITPGTTAPVAIAAGASAQLTCTETRNDGSTYNVTAIGGSWWSTDPSIAGVDSNSGLVTGVAQGMCVITKRFVQSMFGGSGSDRPSNLVTASVTVVVTP